MAVVNTITKEIDPKLNQFVVEEMLNSQNSSTTERQNLPYILLIISKTPL